MPAKELWVYRARLILVKDGDTVDLTLDQGFRTTRGETVRLAGLNTPEMGTPGGVMAKQWVVNWFADHNVGEWPLVVQSQKGPTYDKYRRWLAHIWAGERHLNADLLAGGHAVVYPSV